MDSPPLPNPPTQSANSPASNSSQSQSASSPRLAGALAKRAESGSTGEGGAKPTSSKRPLLFGVIVLLLASLGYLGYQNWQFQQQINRFEKIIQVDNTPNDFSSPSPYPSLSPIPTATSNPTASWKLIEQKNWTFKVPPSWNYWQCDPNTLDTVFVGPNIDQDKVEECAFESTGVMSVSRHVQKLAIPDNSDPDFQVVNKTTIQVGGKMATKAIITVKEGPAQGTWTYVYIDNPTYMDTVVLQDQSYESIFDQILSTFKFLD